MEEKNNLTQKEVTIDDLAMMVAKGFDAVNEKMDKGFKEVNEKMDKGFKEVALDTKDIKAELNKKVDKIDNNTLIYRVEKLEEKFA